MFHIPGIYIFPALDKFYDSNCFILYILCRLGDGPRRPLVVYRLVTDFLLVHLFTGPKPKDVMAQLTAYVGRMPKTPAKFALGYTLCRETGKVLHS